MSFYALVNPPLTFGGAVTEFMVEPGAARGSARRCPKCGGFTSMLELLPPVPITIETWGQECGDLAFGGSQQLLASDKLRECMESKRIVGFEKFGSVRIVEWKRRRPSADSMPGYSIASIAYGNAAVDDQKSGLERTETAQCPECRLGGVVQRFERIIIEPNTWSGEDIFYPRGLGAILVSSKFKQVCDDEGLLNCCMIPASEYGRDHAKIS